MPATTFANLRDVGGLPLTGGGQTRPGVLLRCSAPMPDEALPEGLRDRPFTVVDLRSAAEEPQYDWTDDVMVFRHNLFEPGDLTRWRDVDLAALYREMLAVAGRRIVAVADMLRDDGPTLIHCTAGKDRTGVVVAVLLLLCGVEHSAILTDYSRTEAEMPAVVDRLTAIGVVDTTTVAAAWYTAPTAAMSAVIAALTRHPGGPVQWFVDNGGDLAVLEAVRQRLRGEHER